MKKILFSAVTLDVGGIETALVTLLNCLVNKYEITLVLEKKQGIFLDELDSRIKIIEYSPSNNKIVLIRKFINLLKQLKFKNKYKNKFDFACSYATYSNPASFVARTASENSVLWCHMDYLSQYGGDKKKVKQFFEEKHYKEFSKLVFVSEKSKQTFLEVFPEMEDKVEFINNLIDYKEIERKAEESIPEENLFEKKNDETIFLNYGRQEESQKRLYRIIEAAEKLKELGTEFKIIFIGDGTDSNNYKKRVQELDLEEEIIFLGRKKNPFPYVKKSDCVLLTSEYEGSPVVFTETMILNKSIITTDVAGSEQIEGKFGYVVGKDVDAIANAMQLFIEKGFKIERKFDVEKYNCEALEKIKDLIDLKG